MKAIRVEKHGGPEVLEIQEVGQPKPAAGEVVFEVDAAGLNFIDVYRRTGLYPNDLPGTPGVEAAGDVVAVGDGVKALKVGDRVVSTHVKGAYAEHATVDAERAVLVPEGVSTRDAAAVMLQGMTAHYLARSTFPLQEGDSCLVHAGAGGVGLLLIQVAKRCGARVFATVGSAEKAELARGAGADEVILYKDEDFLSVVKEKTAGQGLHVVYDSVGRDTFEKSLDSLTLRGMLVLYGQSSGTVPALELGRLAQGGSLFLTRPSLFHYIPDRGSLERRAGDVLGWVADGSLKVRIGTTFPLGAAADAHRALEGRKTTGKVLLLP